MGFRSDRDGTAGYNIVPDELRAVQLECVFFGSFRDVVGEKTIRRETTADAVGELLAEFEATYPELEGELIADDGDGLAGRTVVSVDDRDIRHLEGLETPLEADAVIRVTPSAYC